MKSSRILILLLLFCGAIPSAMAQYPYRSYVTAKGKGKVNTWVDNMGYWKEMVRKGYVTPDPYIQVPEATYTTSVISGDEIRTQNSPDIPTTSEENTTQSENSIAVNPYNEEEVFNSNNSTTWNGVLANQLYGADHLFSDDAALTWGGSILYAGELNFGDPVTAIGLNGRQYLGKINNNFGQSVAWSDDKGLTWHEVIVGEVPSPGNDILDKNHLCIDNSPSSPYAGNLYDAWTTFLSGQNGKIEVTRSVDHGLTWLPSIEISLGANAVYNNQGVNLQTGPGGELYAVWAVYDSPSADETALGFARSFNGGSVFMPATRIIDNIRGIRSTGAGKSMRVNSFPSMAVDISGGSNSGAIYVVWANVGVPGFNTGSDVDIYMIRSFDQGSTWSAPIRINQDPAGLGKKHYLPWITCDPDNGNLAVIYYDDRNTSSFKCETYISYSYDAGDSWTDLKVSDVEFTPSPIPGLATSYFGDYLGITAKNRKVYPVWTDNRSGHAMSYVSPVDLGPAPGQSFVVYDSQTLTKIGQTGTAPGMGYGDSLYLNLGMRNLGDEAATGVTCYLSTSSPYVTITDSTSFYGDFQPDEMKTIDAGFSFDVSDTIPDNLRVRFNIRAVSTDTLWKSHFTLKAMAPGLRISGLFIQDSVNGNNNHRLDPGENATILLRLSNTGDYPCTNAYSLLATHAESIVLLQDSVFSGTIPAGGYADAAYPVQVSEDAVFGSWLDLVADAYSGRYDDHYTFIETIGIVVEDWETGNFQKYPWTFAGNANWIVTQNLPYEGNFCAKSRPVFDQQSSVLKINYVSGVSDSISFRVKTSSEPSYDYLNFYIDNIKQGQWSGETPWTRVSFPAPAGNHEYRWTYQKDVFYGQGDDCGYIDFIEFPPPVLPQVNAGNDDTLCTVQPYQLTGVASGYDSLRWTTYGDGQFDNDTLISPVYTPGTGDAAAGSVRLRMVAWGHNGNSSNSMILYLGSIPQTNGIRVYPNDTVCAGQTIDLSVDTISGCSYSWLPGGSTSPEIIADTNLTGGSGTFMIRAFTISPLNCTTKDSLIIHFKDCTGAEEISRDSKITATPNPFSESTMIRIPLTDNEAEFCIIDEKGNIVRNLNDKKISGEATILKWDGTTDTGEKAASGIYQLVVRSADAQRVFKLILVR